MDIVKIFMEKEGQQEKVMNPKIHCQRKSFMMWLKENCENKLCVIQIKKVDLIILNLLRRKINLF